MTRPAARALAPFVTQFRLEPARARIGDRLTLTIDIDATATIESIQPRVEERLGEFDVLSIDSTPIVKGDGTWHQTWRVTLAAFDKGDVRLPRFAIDYTAAGGQTLAYWAETGLNATITSPTVTADMPLRPTVGRQDPPPQSPWPRIALIGGILSLVIGIASVPLVVWWLRAMRRRRQLAFFRQLQRELARIGEAPTGTPEEARAAYTRAAEILRLGVGRVAPGQTASLPSPELASHLARIGAEGLRLAAKLRLSLSAVDAVRFGNTAPTPHRHTATIGEAGGVVQSMGATAANQRPPKARAS
ncbi:MAG: BatD family protein [Vicinamibacteraceae bacterium]